MASSSTEPELTPARIFDTINAHQRSAALKAAVEIDLFTAIATGHATVDTLAAHCGTDRRATRILCDYLTVGGFLTKNDGRYGLAHDVAVFLNRQSPAYLGDVTRFMHSESLLEAFRDIAAVVRTGRTQLPGEGTVETNFQGWVDFARSMVPMMRGPAEFLGVLARERLPGKRQVLDIAAGHGLFGICVAQNNPEAQITALDWQPVLEVAKENAQRHQLLDRYRCLPGDALAMEYGGPFDLVLITNFLHHFPHSTCVDALRRVRRAVAPGGLVFTLEFIPNPDRVSPPMPAEFAFTMLGTTTRGDAYTFDEYQSMFAEAGFREHELLDVPRSTQRLIVTLG